MSNENNKRIFWASAGVVLLSVGAFCYYAGAADITQDRIDDIIEGSVDYDYNDPRIAELVSERDSYSGNARLSALVGAIATGFAFYNRNSLSK